MPRYQNVASPHEQDDCLLSKALSPAGRVRQLDTGVAAAFVVRNDFVTDSINLPWR
jgi:hypothetical protein